MTVQVKAPEVAATDARAAATAALRDVYGIEHLPQLAEMAAALNAGRQKLDEGYKRYMLTGPDELAVPSL